jgi:hypothetical protein
MGICGICCNFDEHQGRARRGGQTTPGVARRKSQCSGTHCVKDLQGKRPGSEGACSERIGGAVAIRIRIIAEPIVPGVAAIVARDGTRCACEQRNPIRARIQTRCRGRKSAQLGVTF